MIANRSASTPAPARAARVRALACALALAAAAVVRAATPVDLTLLSLEELMDVELPPESASASFQVSATAIDSCTINATDLDFGNYDPLQSTPTDGTSLVTVACTVGSGYTIGLDAGTGAGATTLARVMSGAEHTLRYSLYRDASRALVWGDSGASDSVAGVGTGVPVDYTVYGRIVAGQPVRRGLYIDTITVTVSY